MKKITLKALALILLINPVASTFGQESIQRFWGSAEYLYWWVQGGPVSIPLITTNTNPAAFGFLNEPGSSVLFGAGSSRNSFEFGALSSGRVTYGVGIDNAMQYGIEGNAFYLPSARSSFSASTLAGNFPVINVPFNSGNENVLVNKETPNAALVSDKVLAYGYEINGVSLSPSRNFPVRIFMGFRYLNIEENFLLNDMSVPATGIVNVRDDFLTKNHFYGMQLGAKTELQYARLFLDIFTSIAIGNNHELLKISGFTSFNGKILQNFGLFSEPTNLGTYSNNIIAVVPELQVKLKLKLRQYIQPFLSYNGFYMNHVLRAEEVINRNINKSQNPLIGGTGFLNGVPAPLPQHNNISMWIQGISAGFDVHW